MSQKVLTITRGKFTIVGSSGDRRTAASGLATKSVAGSVLVNSAKIGDYMKRTQSQFAKSLAGSTLSSSSKVEKGALAGPSRKR